MGGGTVCVRRNDTHVLACLLAFGALWAGTEGYLLAGRVRGTEPSVEAGGCCGSQVFLVLVRIVGRIALSLSSRECHNACRSAASSALRATPGNPAEGGIWGAVVCMWAFGTNETPSSKGFYFFLAPSLLFFWCSAAADQESFARFLAG